MSNGEGIEADAMAVLQAPTAVAGADVIVRTRLQPCGFVSEIAMLFIQH